MLKKLGLIFLAMTMFVAIGYGQAAGQAEGVKIVAGGIGDELNGIYDVRVEGETGRTATGWQNFFVIENTSGNWTAVHLRLRAHKCSIEVWDHIILLSPYDMFWFALDNKLGDGNVRIFSKDNDTLLNSGLIFEPLVGNERWEDWLSDELMQEIGSVNSMDYGHVEVIGMFQLALLDDWFGTTDTHNLAEVVKDLFPLGGDTYINAYDVLQAAYYEFSPGLVPQVGMGWVTLDPADLLLNYHETPQRDLFSFDWRMVTDCGNALAGNYIWGDLDTAEMGMENMVAMEDFRLDDPQAWTEDVLSLIHRDGHYSGAIVFPPQNVNLGGVPPSGLMPDLFFTSPAWYLNPDWATQVGPTLRDGDALLAGFPVVCDPVADTLLDRFNDVWSQYDVDWAYSKFEVWYNYFQLNPFGGDEVYATDVYFVFKTKYLNDIECSWPYWNSLPWNETPGGVLDYLKYVAQLRGSSSYSCNTDDVCFTVTAWDTDEETQPPGPEEPSPGEFRYPVCVDAETNIMRFSTDPDLVSTPTVFYSPFLMGHFRVNDFRNYGFRYATNILADPIPIPLVPGLYGITYFRHTFVVGGIPDFIRSAMAEWHYRDWSFPLDD